MSTSNIEEIRNRLLEIDQGISTPPTDYIGTRALISLRSELKNLSPADRESVLSSVSDGLRNTIEGGQVS